MPKEVWKKLKEFEKFYRVSSEGNIFSLKSNKKLKPHISPAGYYCINVGNTRYDRRAKPVHILIARTFLEKT